MEDREKRKTKVPMGKIRMIIGIILAVFLLGAVSFSYFYVMTEGRIAMREAKNIKLALDLLNVEYYGSNKKVFDSTKSNGLASGVEDRVKEITDHTGQVTIRSYNSKAREITCLIYEKDRFRVTYTSDSEGEGWKVEYMITVLDYTAE